MCRTTVTFYLSAGRMMLLSLLCSVIKTPGTSLKDNYYTLNQLHQMKWDNAKMPQTLVIGCTMLLGAYYLLGTWFFPGTRHHLLSSCSLYRVHNGSKRLSENHGTNCKHTIHLLIILKSNKEELHRFLPLVGNTKSQATSFAAYG